MSIHEKFKNILATSAFEQLLPYTQPHVWDSLSHNERELLGILFVSQGEHQLKNGDSKVLESFELASKVAPESPQVFFRQAMIYADQGQNIRCLAAASKALEKVTHLDPSFVSAWHSWGNVLVRTAIFYEDVSYFYQADAKFHEAEHLCLQQGARHEETLWWHWGVCWYHIGKHSGEAVDLFRSLEKFRMAEKAGCDSGEFHNDFGNVLVDLGCLVNGRKELLLEAIDHYHQFTDFSSGRFEGWLNLASTYQKLYDFTCQSDYFFEAEVCFERASELNSEDPAIWLRWAELLVSSGKNSRDLERLQASFEKFEKASQLDPEFAEVQLRWGEAQMILASYTENLELLHEAKNKISRAVEILAHDPDAWYVYGVCLSEFGRYFASEHYYYQAIEKLQYGLSLNSTHPLLLHAMALAYFSAGDLIGDSSQIEKSVYYCNKVAETGLNPFPHFLNDWGVALMKLGEMTNDQSYIEAAAEKFELAISRRLETPDEEVEIEWLYNYGCAMDFLGDFHEEPVYYEKAVQVLSHILQLDPNYHHARYNLALALFHLGELNADVDSFHKAIDLFHELVQQDPEDEMAWNDYGLTLLNLAVLKNDPANSSEAQQLFAQAEAKLEQAVALGNVNAFYNIACLYALTDNVSAAMHYMERAESSNALPPVDDLMHDEWLESMRHLPAFRMLISRLLSQDADDN